MLLLGAELARVVTEGFEPMAWFVFVLGFEAVGLGAEPGRVILDLEGAVLLEVVLEVEPDMAGAVPLRDNPKGGFVADLSPEGGGCLGDLARSPVVVIQKIRLLQTRQKVKLSIIKNGYL